MSNVNLKVDTAALNSDANELMTEINAVLSQTAKMYDSVQTLNNMWKGKANDAFRAQFTKDYENTKAFLEDLRGFAQTLSDDSSAYTACEANVVSCVGKI